MKFPKDEYLLLSPWLLRHLVQKEAEHQHGFEDAWFSTVLHFSFSCPFYFVSTFVFSNSDRFNLLSEQVWEFCLAFVLDWLFFF